MPYFAAGTILLPDQSLFGANRFAGDLWPRHMQVFRANEFFRGVTLPQPDSVEPLENRLPKHAGAAAIDFLKVLLRVVSPTSRQIRWARDSVPTLARLTLYWIDPQRCVDKEPDRRWSCERLLRHVYFHNFRCSLPAEELREFEKLKLLRDRSRVRKFNSQP